MQSLLTTNAHPSSPIAPDISMVRKLKRPGRSVVRESTIFDRDDALRKAADHYHHGRFADADDVYQSLCMHDPDDALPWYLRGLLACQRGRYAEAVAHLQHALAGNGAAALRFQIEFWLGTALTSQERRRDARVHLQAAAGCAWNDVEKLTELIPLFLQADAVEEMEPLLRRVLELDPTHVEAQAELSLCEVSRGDLHSALQRATSALEEKPGIPAALRTLGHVHHIVGDMKSAQKAYADAVDEICCGKGIENLFDVYESMLGALVYTDVSDDELRQAHERWQTFMAPQTRPRKQVLPRGGRPLRIGYVSPDFNDHAVSYFFEHLLQNHEPAVVTTILYANSSKKDHVSERLRASAAGWRDIVDLGDGQVADLIEQDRIDILVDLAGYTVGNRMPVFHLRPAPLQVSYLGYPCTTGLAQMDYRFTDEDCDPLGETDAVYTEKLVRLPGGFYAWRPPDTAPDVVAPPAATNGFITFGSLNTLSKITDDVIALWSRLLHEVPRSRLVLQAGPLADSWVRARIAGKFASHGIEAARLDLHGRMPLLEHLGLYHQIDVALDPFPWGGHTTTCTALFMGVPVVTLRGRRMASRMSASVLRRMGFDAWIAESPDQYLHIARSLAADVDRLEAIRLGQREVFVASDLTDGARLARVIEAAYLAIWDHHAGG
jgi:predicted O-linked N-acetylglucosamine transferase (SPINDLY family)